jgi:hypothetical protein
VKCSPKTGAALWYGDPFDGTVPMGKMPLLDKIARRQGGRQAALRQAGPAGRSAARPATTAWPQVQPAKGFPRTTGRCRSRPWKPWCPSCKNFQHGRGRIWCLDCHHTTKRNMLVDHFGDPVSFDQPQLLCGKCHGDKLRDWRDGIHGKRIGEFASTGKKRWFTCTECHNPHNVQDGARNRGFIQLAARVATATAQRHEGREVRKDAPDRRTDGRLTRPEPPRPGRGDPTWVAPALTREEQTRTSARRRSSSARRWPS